jgi:hypothetical protein
MARSTVVGVDLEAAIVEEQRIPSPKAAAIGSGGLIA